MYIQIVTVRKHLAIKGHFYKLLSISIQCQQALTPQIRSLKHKPFNHYSKTHNAAQVSYSAFPYRVTISWKGCQRSWMGWKDPLGYRASG